MTYTPPDDPGFNPTGPWFEDRYRHHVMGPRGVIGVVVIVIIIIIILILSKYSRGEVSGTLRIKQVAATTTQPAQKQDKT